MWTFFLKLIQNLINSKNAEPEPDTKFRIYRSGSTTLLLGIVTYPPTTHHLFAITGNVSIPTNSVAEP